MTTLKSKKRVKVRIKFLIMSMTTKLKSRESSRLPSILKVLSSTESEKDQCTPVALSSAELMMTDQKDQALSLTE